MMRIGLAVLSAALMTIVLWTASAAPVKADDPVGRYTVTGTNPGNRGTYSGSVVIDKTGDTYRVVWQIGNDRYIGTGIGNDQFIAVSYKFGSDTGLALYSASGAGWKGIWAYSGGQTLGSEIWSRR